MWYWIGFLRDESFYSRMGLPPGTIFRDPPYYIQAGFLQSLFFLPALVYLAFAVLGLRFFLKHRQRSASDAGGAFPSHALLPLVTAATVLLAILRFFIGSKGGVSR